MNILLCSNSPLKTKVVYDFYKSLNIVVNITNFNCDELKLPAQPIDSALQCAKLRLDYAKSKIDIEYDTYIAIENGIVVDEYGYRDECCVIIDDGIMSSGSKSLEIPKKYEQDIYNLIISKSKHDLGHDVTFGEILTSQNSTIDPKNWMLKVCNCDRTDMIMYAMNSTISDKNYQKKLVDNVINAYKSYPDFPKPGVLFQDIFAVLADKDALQDLCKIMSSRYLLDKVDYIVGLESRGFFGVLLAKELSVGFIPIRKAGKLPGIVEQVEYGTEYSKDICEISSNIPKHSRVIVFDDLIATGGSLNAAVILLEKLECIIVDLCILREVTDLRDKAKATLNRSYTVLL